MSVDFFITDGAAVVPVEYAAWKAADKHFNRLSIRSLKAEQLYLKMVSGKESIVGVHGIQSTDFRDLMPDTHAEVACKVCSPEWRRALKLAATEAGKKANHLEQVAESS